MRADQHLRTSLAVGARGSTEIFSCAGVFAFVLWLRFVERLAFTAHLDHPRQAERASVFICLMLVDIQMQMSMIRFA